MGLVLLSPAFEVGFSGDGFAEVGKEDEVEGEFAEE